MDRKETQLGKQTVKQLRDTLLKAGVRPAFNTRKAQLLEMATRQQETALTTESDHLSGLSSLSLQDNDGSVVSDEISQRHQADDPLPCIPSIEDDISHLAPGFNPETLCVAKLRNLLLINGIEYGAAKKAELVQLFQSKIAPKAAATLRAMAQVKPSSRGIADA
ncbi:sister chromatid separation protein [Colletotrichum tofieldiae]|uniref:Sister chromatid separation protein n=1 Tax=Colletotrichum tofieldiae TaxID=708197 RepID=A0A166NLV6_9PEZI|nr:sister chromatid separation protein [Colletotrichum tofieldiae]GKT97260.1 sister chromatid separation protein [Colletotrichum tofieldiae]